MKKERKENRRIFDEKNWNEIKTKDSWQIFKIMSEFVEGFETMGKIGPCVPFSDQQELQWKIHIIV